MTPTEFAARLRGQPLSSRRKRLTEAVCNVAALVGAELERAQTRNFAEQLRGQRPVVWPRASAEQIAEADRAIARDLAIAQLRTELVRRLQANQRRLAERADLAESHSSSSCYLWGVSLGVAPRGWTPGKAERALVGRPVRRRGRLVGDVIHVMLGEGRAFANVRLRPGVRLSRKAAPRGRRRAGYVELVN